MNSGRSVWYLKHCEHDKLPHAPGVLMICVKKPNGFFERVTHMKCADIRKAAEEHASGLASDRGGVLAYWINTDPTQEKEALSEAEGPTRSRP